MVIGPEAHYREVMFCSTCSDSRLYIHMTDPGSESLCLFCVFGQRYQDMMNYEDSYIIL